MIWKIEQSLKERGLHLRDCEQPRGRSLCERCAATFQTEQVW
jgi:hypothetical protein